MNRRNAVLALLALGVAPLVTEAQQPAKPARIAVLRYANPETAAAMYLLDAFKQRLRELGYVEGQNVVFEYRSAEGNAERLAGLAKELAALKPDVILVTNTIGALAARDATTTIPIVMTAVADPVGRGLVKSLARPGGNITGLSTLGPDSSPKLLELLLSVVPNLSRVSVLVAKVSGTSWATGLKNIQIEAQKIGVSVFSVEVRNPADIENAFTRLKQENIRAVIVLGDPLFFFHRRQIAELATKNRMLSVFVSREYVEAGGLMSYGENLLQSFLAAANYVDRILKGAKPDELPIAQPTKLELVINLKTAKALGITISQELLFRADTVIE